MIVKPPQHCPIQVYLCQREIQAHLVVSPPGWNRFPRKGGLRQLAECWADQPQWLRSPARWLGSVQKGNSRTQSEGEPRPRTGTRVAIIPPAEQALGGEVMDDITAKQSAGALSRWKSIVLLIIGKHWLFLRNLGKSLPLASLSYDLWAAKSLKIIKPQAWWQSAKLIQGERDHLTIPAFLEGAIS